MITAILTTLSAFGWLGLVLLILLAINTGSSIFYNISEGGERFNWKKLGKGLLKSVGFYICCTALAVVCSMIPGVNSMIVASYGVAIFSDAMLTTLSSLGVMAAMVTVIVNQGKKALEGIGKLGNITATIKDNEAVTWTIIDPETEDEQESK